MKKYTVSSTFSYNEEDLLDIISTGICDIGYWCGIHDSNEYYEARDEVPKGSTFEDILLHMLIMLRFNNLQLLAKNIKLITYIGLKAVGKHESARYAQMNL